MGTTAEGIESVRKLEAMRDVRGGASREPSSAVLRGTIIAVIGAAILGVLGSAYFASNAGVNYPEAAAVLGD